MQVRTRIDCRLGGGERRKEKRGGRGREEEDKEEEEEEERKTEGRERREEGRNRGCVCRGGQKARNTHSALLTLFPPACPMLKESERLVTSPLALALSLSLTWGVGRETIARPTLLLFIRPTSQHIPSRTGSNAMEKDHHIHVGETTAQRRGCKVWTGVIHTGGFCFCSCFPAFCFFFLVPHNTTTTTSAIKLPPQTQPPALPRNGGVSARRAE